MDDVAILILAAGASARMRGGDKLLEPVGGEAVLRRQARAALETGARVLVALAPDRPARAAELDGLAVERVMVADAGDGMGHSITAGARAAGGVALMILPGDMPEIDATDMGAVLAAARGDPGRVWRGASVDLAGHPVLFPARLGPKLRNLTGDRGARDVLAGEDVGLVPLPRAHALTDLDTPEDWAAWRAARSDR